MGKARGNQKASCGEADDRYGRCRHGCCFIGDVVDDIDTFVDEEDTIAAAVVSRQLFSHCISIYFGFAWHSPMRAQALHSSLLSVNTSYEDVEFSVCIVSQTLQLFSH